MPELPEVETVRGGLENHLMGRRIEQVELRRPDLRFPFPEGFEAMLRGRLVESVDRRAKYLLIRLDNGTTWITHLGMSGKFTLFSSGDGPNEVGKHDHFAIWLDDGGQAVYTDHRRFGFMKLIETAEQDENRHLAKLGPEPMPDQLTPMDLAENLKGRKASIKSALLDQRTVAGLGNIYVSEALFRAGVSPRRTAASVAGTSGVSNRVERLTGAIHDVIIEAIDAGGSSISDFASVDGALGYFTRSHQVYGREAEPCMQCDASIKRIVQSGRSTFYCPKCQQ